MTQILQHRRHAPGKILGHQAWTTTLARLGMEPASHHGGIEGPGSLCQKPADDAGQDISRSGRGQKWRTVGVHRQPSVVVGNRRVWPLEENDASRFGRGAGDITQAFTGPVEESPEFSDVWRENAVLMEPVEEILSTIAEHRQGIGIENKRLARGERRHHEVTRSFTGARTRSKHSGMDMPGRHQPGEIPGSGEGMIHDSRVVHGMGEKGGPRHGAGDETSPCSQAGSRGKP